MKDDMEKASLMDALQQGMNVGRMLFGPSLNPYQDGTPEHAEWERGRFAGMSVRLAGEIC